MPEDMIHVINYSKDGIVGLSTIQYAVLATGLSLSSEMYVQNFFESGANLAGILTVESSLTDTMIKKIQDVWHKAFRR
jgi:phage portal protein BeeE